MYIPMIKETYIVTYTYIHTHIPKYRDIYINEHIYEFKKEKNTYRNSKLV